MKTTTEARMLSNEELGSVISLMRKLQQWSQETLAELSGLTTRTIQRIEKGEGCSIDSRRALSKAFGHEDIDIYNKPFSIPSPEEVAQQKAEFERERISLTTKPLVTGKQLVQLAETTQAHLFASKENVIQDVDLVLAELEDMFTEFRDSHDCYSATGKVEMYPEFQRRIDTLIDCGVDLCYATRRMSIPFNETNKSIPFTVVYLLACCKGDVPEVIAVSREVTFG